MAFLGFLKEHWDKDYTLNDYRKKEIISIFLIRQQSEYTSLDKLSLKKNDVKVSGIRHKGSLISEGLTDTHFSVFQGRGGVCAKDPQGPVNTAFLS